MSFPGVKCPKTISSANPNESIYLGTVITYHPGYQGYILRLFTLAIYLGYPFTQSIFPSSCIPAHSLLSQPQKENTSRLAMWVLMGAPWIGESALTIYIEGRRNPKPYHPDLIANFLHCGLIHLVLKGQPFSLWIRAPFTL